MAYLKVEKCEKLGNNNRITLEYDVGVNLKLSGNEGEKRYIQFNDKDKINEENFKYLFKTLQRITNKINEKVPFNGLDLLILDMDDWSKRFNAHGIYYGLNAKQLTFCFTRNNCKRVDYSQVIDDNYAFWVRLEKLIYGAFAYQKLCSYDRNKVDAHLQLYNDTYYPKKEYNLNGKPMGSDVYKFVRNELQVGSVGFGDSIHFYFQNPEGSKRLNQHMYAIMDKIVTGKLGDFPNGLDANELAKAIAIGLEARKKGGKSQYFHELLPPPTLGEQSVKAAKFGLSVLTAPFRAVGAILDALPEADISYSSTKSSDNVELEIWGNASEGLRIKEKSIKTAKYGEMAVKALRIREK